MILKLMIDYYRWLWNLPPFDTTIATMGCVLFFGAILDILAIVGTVGLIVTNKDFLREASNRLIRFVALMRTSNFRKEAQREG